MVGTRALIDYNIKRKEHVREGVLVGTRALIDYNAVCPISLPHRVLVGTRALIDYNQTTHLCTHNKFWLARGL